MAWGDNARSKLFFIWKEYADNTMTVIFHRPVFSKRWLGRPFILIDDSLAWGRYVVTDTGFPEVAKEEHGLIESGFREAEPYEIAKVFEDLLCLFNPGALVNSLQEIEALCTYDLAKRHVAAQARTGYAPDAYNAARAAMAKAFEDALSSVFEAAKPVHGLNDATFVRYRQILHGSHLATFADDQQTYDVAFSPDLVLESVHLDSDWSRVWPPTT
jgi:hypothetical protein